MTHTSTRPSRVVLLLVLLLSIGCHRNSAGYLAEPVLDVVTLPFSLERGLIIVQARVNGVSGRFVMDNGFTLSACNADFAERAGITFTASASVRDGNNRNTRIGRARAQEISMGPITILRSGIYQIDSEKFLPCTPIDGILGASVINRLNWSFDFVNRTVKVSSRPFPAEGIRIPLRISRQSNSSFLTLSLHQSDLQTKIDLGYNGELKVHRSAGASLSGQPANRMVGIASLSATGLGKTDTTFSFPNQVLAWKDTRLPMPVEIDITRHLKYSARLGTGYLRQYRLVLNNSQKEMILAPAQQESNRALPLTMGISLYPIDSVYRIIQIQPDLPDVSDLPLFGVVERLDSLTLNDQTDFCALREYVGGKRQRREPVSLWLAARDTAVILPYREPALRPYEPSQMTAE